MAARKTETSTTTHDIVFRLLAPYNEQVELTGSWDDWKRTPMTKGDDGVWRATVPLADGDYEYKFIVRSLSYFMPGKEAHGFDPYAVGISLNHENACMVVRGGQSIVHMYQWQHDDAPLPANQQLVIYEMNISEFTGGVGDGGDEQHPAKGTFADAIRKLDTLAELGINAIELMPIKEFPGTRGWGYNSRSLYAIENGYGQPDDFARFVDECHARGIRVIIDAVYNHMDADAPLTRIDYEYWFHNPNPDPDFLQWGPKFNYFHYDANHDRYPARDYVIGSIMHWIEHFHIDGIRFDATYAINNFDLLRWMHDQIAQKIGGIKPFITIAEHVPEDPAITGPHGPLDAAWHDSFGKQMQATIATIEKDGRHPYDIEGLATLMQPGRNGYAGASNTINYIDNHDQDRIMWQLGAYAHIFDAAAFRRLKLGAALLLTAPGIPMLWMGQEFGEAAPRTLYYQPIDWALLKNDANADLWRRCAALVHLRTSTPALHNDSFEVILRDDARGIFAFKRWDDGGGVVVVVVNLYDRYGGEFTLANVGLEDGTWHEYLYDYDTQVQGGTLRDVLAESEAKIFIRR